MKKTTKFKLIALGIPILVGLLLLTSFLIVPMFKKRLPENCKKLGVRDEDVYVGANIPECSENKSVIYKNSHNEWICCNYDWIDLITTTTTIRTTYFKINASPELLVKDKLTLVDTDYQMWVFKFKNITISCSGIGIDSYGYLKCLNMMVE